jgi:hypothetical protein
MQTRVSSKGALSKVVVKGLNGRVDVTDAMAATRDDRGVTRPLLHYLLRLSACKPNQLLPTYHHTNEVIGNVLPRSAFKNQTQFFV